MAGRFVFLAFAAGHLSPDDLGRYGLIAAGVLLSVTLVGLELHATLGRILIQGTDCERLQAANAYLFVIVAGSTASAFLSIYITGYLGWTLSIMLLVAAVGVAEYVSIEVMRLLIFFGRGDLAILNVFLRTGSWAYALPIANALELAPLQWSLDLVLIAWLTGAVASLGPALLLASRARLRVIDPGRTCSLLLRCVPTVLPWITATGAWRTIEVGGRFFVAHFHSEAASGRFMLLATMASIGSVAFRGVIEPTWFRRLTASEKGALRQFTQLTIVFVVLGAVATVVCASAYVRMTGIMFEAGDWYTLSILLAAYAALGLSQIAHFALYSHHHDRSILLASLGAMFILILSSVILVPRMSLLGSAVATLLSAIALFLGKLIAVYFCRTRSNVSVH